MKTKRIVSAVLTAALLIFALLVSSCMDLTREISDNDNDEGDNYQVTPGKGLVRFKISNSTTERTTFPDTDITKMYFRLTFKAHGISAPDIVKPTASTTYNIASALDTITLKVDDGTYDVFVEAFNESTGASGNLISAAVGAKNATTGYVVDSGAASACEISLTLGGKISKANWDGLGAVAKQGTFAYAITLPSTPSGGHTDSGKFANVSHKLSVYPYDGAVKGTALAAFNGKDISGTSSGSGKIDSGVYLIEVVSKSDYCQDRVLTEVMYIYDNLTTTYSKTAPAFNQNIFTVNLELGDDVTNNLYTKTKEVGNAELVGSLPTPTDPLDGYVFDDWYTTDALTTKFNFSNTRIYSDDVSIFAGWNQKIETGGDVEVELVFTTPGSTAGISTVYKVAGVAGVAGDVTFDGLDDNHSIEITLTNVASIGLCKLGDGTNLAGLVSGSGPFVLTIDKNAMDSTGVLYKKLVFGANKNIITVTGIGTDTKEFCLEIAVNVSK